MSVNAPSSSPGLPDNIFDSLPESVRSYIRYLEATIQQQQVIIAAIFQRLANKVGTFGKP